MISRLQFQEGKACDAVIRHLERRDSAQRADLRSPEREHHPAPIELTCRIGSTNYAFEHTGIEPFAGHMDLEAEAETHFKPLEAMLAGSLPPNEVFVLLVPTGCMRGLRGSAVKRVHEVLIRWVKETGPSLPIARRGRYITPVKWVSLPGIEFQVSLQRSEATPLSGRFMIRHLFTGNLESDRLSRVQLALSRKCPKLAVWKRSYCMRTVLVLEENDIFLTNDYLVADAVKRAEQDIADKPDEVYLVSTAVKNSWWLVPIRVGCQEYPDTGDLEEVDPAGLDSLTLR